MGTGINWTAEIIDLLRTLWNKGETTPNIAKTICERHAVEIDKNAVCGKKARLSRIEPGLWDVRESPIQRSAVPKIAAGASTLPVLPSERRPPPPTVSTTVAAPFAETPRPVPVAVQMPEMPMPIAAGSASTQIAPLGVCGLKQCQTVTIPLFVAKAIPASAPKPVVVAFPVPMKVRAAVSENKPPTRDPNLPLRRRDGSGCVWPIGKAPKILPYCDEPLVSLERPYCRRHQFISIHGTEAWEKTHGKQQCPAD